MARRKFKRRSTGRRRVSGTKTRSRRRHRVGASALNFSATSPLVKWGSVALGYLKPDLIPIEKMVGDKIDGKIVAGAQVGLGFLLAFRKGKKKGMLTTVLGGYLMGAGLKKALQEFGVITGIGPYGRVPVIGQFSPYGRVNVLNGYSSNRGIKGFTPNGTINKVMTGVNTGSYTNNASGSGINRSDPGSNLMN